MTRADLINAWRARVNDLVEPYLWNDDEAQEYLDDAHNEAAERARLIRDASTAAICTIAVIAGTAGYTLDARILGVERAKLDLQRLPLQLTSTSSLDSDRGTLVGRSNGYSPVSGVAFGWETLTGTPVAVAIDDEAGKFKATLVPIPVVNDTLRLQVFRLPLASMVNDTDVPEIPYRQHIRLVDWMEHRAYSKHDMETRDDAKAAQAEAVFTSAFGERIDANVRRKQEDRATSVVQFQF